MSLPRRRLIRPVAITDEANSQQQRRAQKLRDRLSRERAALARWQARLRRAFNAADKCQKQIARLERQIANLEG
jgi:septal ring factor EnvC (AmiA/AmiB activator)